MSIDRCLHGRGAQSRPADRPVQSLCYPPLEYEKACFECKKGGGWEPTNPWVLNQLKFFRIPGTWISAKIYQSLCNSAGILQYLQIFWSVGKASIIGIFDNWFDFSKRSF